jgi:ATP-binding cassette subfamily B multidrug efflux pump
VKPQDFKGTVRRLFAYLSPYKFSLIMILITAILGTVFNITAPKLIGNVVTELFEGALQGIKGEEVAGINVEFITRMLLILIALYLFSSLFSYIQQFLAGSIAHRTVYDLRKGVNDKLSRLPLKFYDSRTHGDLLSRAVNDVDNISTSLQQVVSQLLTSVITIIGVIVMMITISPLLTAVILITLPISFFGIKAITSRSMPHFKGIQKTLGELNGHIEETYSGHTIVKAYGKEKDNIESFRNINQRIYQSGKMAQFISGIIMPLMSIINNFSFILICVIGGGLVTRGSITVGDVTAFINYARMFSQPLMQVANIANMVQSGVASAERIFEILDEPDEIQDLEKPDSIANPHGEVTFDRVNFSYKTDEPLIEEMNIHVKQGQSVAIVGPTGAGKSTIVNLLMRFYELDSGRIMIDGLDVTRLSRGELRSLFGMVLQDTWLFTGTIKENIAYGKVGATDEQIIEAARYANADGFIRKLPEGYSTFLQEGDSLSQGQKQLLTIARALLADPVILLLDEATSSVDTRTEVHIQKAMKNLMKDRTSFIIAHRLSTIRDADLILVMNKGTIVEQGTHAELIERQGYYAELFHSQFEDAGMEKVAQ